MAEHAIRDEGLVVHRRRAGPGIAVVTAVGEVDLLTASRLRQALARTRERTTVVDLTGVTFLAAAGLSVLVDANDAARADGRRFGVVAANGTARRTLEVSGVAEVVPAYSTLADAVPD
ncbi:MAG: STAS domain-containing protein [Actinophytocola sp.]|uniref:STAS domain-containing protein n=1 Tax=Actinophytocola sp. TaxID=1872138 RepID=UPI003D6ADD24